MTALILKLKGCEFMAIPKKILIDLINDLPDEKIGKVISFVRFIKEEDDQELVLEPDDEEDIMRILKEDIWYTSDELKKELMDNRDE